jgi:hypothetical protein
MAQRFFCGCAHDLWGMLLIFAAFNLFLHLAYSPSVFEVYNVSADIRSALKNCETKYAAVDSAVGSYTYTGTGSTATTNNAAFESSLNTLAALTATGRLNPSTIAAARAANEAQMYLYQNISMKTAGRSYLASTATVGWTAKAYYTDYPKYFQMGIYLYPSRSGTGASPSVGVFSSTRVLNTPSVYSSTNVRSVDLTTTQTISSLGLWEKAAKLQTTMVTSALSRTEAYAVFLFFGTLVSLFQFAYLIWCYKRSYVPSWSWIFALVGMVCMFFCYTIGYNPYGIDDPTNMTTLEVLGSPLTSSSLVAAPALAVLNLLWPFELVYSIYLLK